jgi:hypothetical protein
VTTMKYAHLAALVAVAFLQGCATMMNGTTQTVRIETDPPGATLTILPDGVQAVSPAEIELGRKAFRTIEVRLDGYEVTRIYLDRYVEGEKVAPNVVIDPLFFLMKLSWGPVLLDFETGGAFRLAPDPVVIKLAPINAAASQ